MVHCKFYGQRNAVKLYDDWMEDLKTFSPGFQSKPKEVLLVSLCIRVHCILSHLTLHYSYPDRRDFSQAGKSQLTSFLELEVSVHRSQQKGRI